MHAHEIEALPVSEFNEWLVHFQLAHERREKTTKPAQNQLPKKERERLEAARARGEAPEQDG